MKVKKPDAATAKNYLANMNGGTQMLFDRDNCIKSGGV